MLHCLFQPLQSLLQSCGSTIVAASRECLNASHSDREDGYIALRVVLLLQLLVELVVALVVIAIAAAVVVVVSLSVAFAMCISVSRFALDFEFFINTLDFVFSILFLFVILLFHFCLIAAC